MLSFARVFSAIFFGVTACYHPSTDAVMALVTRAHNRHMLPWLC